MSWNEVMGAISTLALSLPIITMFYTGLAGYRQFPVLLVYYLMVVGYNLFTEGYVAVPANFTRYYGVVNNLLDAPLMLTFLTYFGTTSGFKQRMKILVAVLVVFEIVVVAFYGLTIEAITIILGPAIVLILSFSIPFFVRQTKITITHQKAMGKSMITASLLFAYGCYTIIYIMYYLLKIRDVQNTFLVYFFVSTFSSLLMSTGILIEKKRVKKLSELIIARKELSEIYAKENMSAPLKPAVYDHNKDK